MAGTRKPKAGKWKRGGYKPAGQAKDSPLFKDRLKGGTASPGQTGGPTNKIDIQLGDEGTVQQGKPPRRTADLVSQVPHVPVYIDENYNVVSADKAKFILHFENGDVTIIPSEKEGLRLTPLAETRPRDIEGSGKTGQQSQFDSSRPLVKNDLVNAEAFVNTLDSMLSAYERGGGTPEQMNSVRNTIQYMIEKGIPKYHDMLVKLADNVATDSGPRQLEPNLRESGYLQQVNQLIGYLNQGGDLLGSIDDFKSRLWAPPKPQPAAPSTTGTSGGSIDWTTIRPADNRFILGGEPLSDVTTVKGDGGGLPPIDGDETATGAPAEEPAGRSYASVGSDTQPRSFQDFSEIPGVRFTIEKRMTSDVNGQRRSAPFLVATSPVMDSTTGESSLGNSMIVSGRLFKGREGGLNYNEGRPLTTNVDIADSNTPYYLKTDAGEEIEIDVSSGDTGEIVAKPKVIANPQSAQIRFARYDARPVSDSAMAGSAATDGMKSYGSEFGKLDSEKQRIITDLDVDNIVSNVKNFSLTFNPDTAKAFDTMSERISSVESGDFANDMFDTDTRFSVNALDLESDFAQQIQSLFPDIDLEALQESGELANLIQSLAAGTNPRLNELTEDTIGPARNIKNLARRHIRESVPATIDGLSIADYDMRERPDRQSVLPENHHEVVGFTRDIMKQQELLGQLERMAAQGEGTNLPAIQQIQSKIADLEAEKAALIQDIKNGVHIDKMPAMLRGLIDEYGLSTQGLDQIEGELNSIIQSRDTEVTRRINPEFPAWDKQGGGMVDEILETSRQVLSEDARQADLSLRFFQNLIKDPYIAGGEANLGKFDAAVRRAFEGGDAVGGKVYGSARGGYTQNFNELAKVFEDNGITVPAKLQQAIRQLESLGQNQVDVDDDAIVSRRMNENVRRFTSGASFGENPPMRNARDTLERYFAQDPGNRDRLIESLGGEEEFNSFFQNLLVMEGAQDQGNKYGFSGYESETGGLTTNPPPAFPVPSALKQLVLNFGTEYRKTLGKEKRADGSLGSAGLPDIWTADRADSSSIKSAVNFPAAKKAAVLESALAALDDPSGYGVEPEFRETPEVKKAIDIAMSGDAEKIEKHRTTLTRDKGYADRDAGFTDSSFDAAGREGRTSTKAQQTRVQNNPDDTIRLKTDEDSGSEVEVGQGYEEAFTDPELTFVGREDALFARGDEGGEGFRRTMARIQSESPEMWEMIQNLGGWESFFKLAAMQKMTPEGLPQARSFFENADYTQKLVDLGEMRKRIEAAKKIDGAELSKSGFLEKLKQWWYGRPWNDGKQFAEVDVNFDPEGEEASAVLPTATLSTLENDLNKEVIEFRKIMNDEFATLSENLNTSLNENVSKVVRDYQNEYMTSSPNRQEVLGDPIAFPEGSDPNAEGEFAAYLGTSQGRPVRPDFREFPVLDDFEMQNDLNRYQMQWNDLLRKAEEDEFAGQGDRLSLTVQALIGEAQTKFPPEVLDAAAERADYLSAYGDASGFGSTVDTTNDLKSLESYANQIPEEGESVQLDDPFTGSEDAKPVNIQEASVMPAAPGIVETVLDLSVGPEGIPDLTKTSSEFHGPASVAEIDRPKGNIFVSGDNMPLAEALASGVFFGDSFAAESSLRGIVPQSLTDEAKALRAEIARESGIDVDSPMIGRIARGEVSEGRVLPETVEKAQRYVQLEDQLRKINNVEGVVPENIRFVQNRLDPSRTMIQFDLPIEGRGGRKQVTYEIPYTTEISSEGPDSRFASGGGDLEDLLSGLTRSDAAKRNATAGLLSIGTDSMSYETINNRGKDKRYRTLDEVLEQQANEFDPDDIPTESVRASATLSSGDLDEMSAAALASSVADEEDFVIPSRDQTTFAPQEPVEGETLTPGTAPTETIEEFQSRLPRGVNLENRGNVGSSAENVRTLYGQYKDWEKNHPRLGAAVRYGVPAAALTATGMGYAASVLSGGSNEVPKEDNGDINQQPQPAAPRTIQPRKPLRSKSGLTTSEIRAKIRAQQGVR